MHPEESKPFLIGPATLVAATNYPSNAGIKIDRAMSTCSPDGGPATFLVGGTATFGTATLQRQWSPDGTQWFNDGAAVSAATLVSVTFARSGWYRWQVTGSGNITVAALYIA